jgi:hypothetical protein
MKNPVMSNNAFVKGVEGKMKSMMGDRPGAPKEMKHFDAFMSNNGEEAKKSANKLCSGLDDAFPLNKNLTVE